jgi:hypothetical protein
MLDLAIVGATLAFHASVDPHTHPDAEMFSTHTIDDL